jgi:hypothetical protein
VYIDSHLEIKDSFLQYVDLENKDSLESNQTLLSKERLLYLIQTNKHYTPNTQYKFMSGLTFFVEIPASQLSSFLKEDIAKLSLLKEFYMVDDIMVPATLDIFHSVNSIYLFFKETPLKTSGMVSGMAKTHKIRPILKLDNHSLPHPKATEMNEEESSLFTSSIRKGLLSGADYEKPSEKRVESKKTKRVRIQDHISMNRSKKNTGSTTS